jgi:hypothetical protein
MTTRRRFFASKERIRQYRTIEIYHPSGVLMRYVSGRIDPKNFTLEASAPRNAGESVEFLGGAFEFQQPEQNDNIVQADLQLGRVGTNVKQVLKGIRGTARAQVGEVVFREYLDGAEPVFVLRLFIRSITMTADGVVIRVEQDNPSDRPVLDVCTPERFPGEGGLI